jgi:hypothetical protein
MYIVTVGEGIRESWNDVGIFSWMAEGRWRNESAVGSCSAVVCPMSAKTKIEAENVTTRSRIAMAEQLSRNAILERMSTIPDAEQKVPVAMVVRGPVTLDAEQVSAV